MVIFTTGGEGYLASHDNEYILTEKSLIVVPTGHSCMFGVKDDDWKILWFYMNPHIHWDLLIERGIRFSRLSEARRVETLWMHIFRKSEARVQRRSAAELPCPKRYCNYLDRALGIAEVAAGQETKNSLEKCMEGSQATVKKSGP
jgi:hypothetical protein